jgi:osmotically-inducible protein OsmY
MDERERRDWRTSRYGREDDYGSSDYANRDYALGDYESGYRSFQPREERGPVFGERETGADYTGPRYGAGGYTGYGDRDYGGRHDEGRGAYGRYGGRQGARRGARYYGDDGRTNLYRGEFTTTSPSDRSYSDYRTDRGWRGGYDTDRDGQRDYQRVYGRRADQDWEGRRYAERETYWDRDRDHGRRDRDGRNFWERATDKVASWFDFDEDRYDGRQAGHRGRGPAGYKRSDERINDEVHERLTDDPWVDASNISISVSGGEVTLSGTVDEREAKHRAERIVEDISGVAHVQNNLRVERGNPLTGSGRGFGDSANAAAMRDRSAAGTQEGAPGDNDLTLGGTGKGSRTQ